MLRWISTNFPQTKVTVHDYLSDMLEQQVDESWVFKTHHYLQPSHTIKHNTTTDDNHRRLLDQGKKIAMVLGVDKPKLCIKDGKWFTYFVDSLAQRNNIAQDDLDSVTTELFYWAPEGCDIMAKQAHLIQQWFEMPVNQGLQHLVQWPNSDYSARTAFESIIKPVIYPDYDFRTFQVAKSSNIYNAEMDTWFFKNLGGTDLFQTWKAGVDYVISNVDHRYLENNNQGTRQYTSPLYYIADAKSTRPGIDTGAVATLNNDVKSNKPTMHCIYNKLVVY